MQYQTIFQRSEIKYLLTLEQAGRIQAAMAPYMEPDRFPMATIRNLYFDTDSYRMIRRSIEKPVYKEKLRIRCYRQVGSQDAVFVELKKKYLSTVYKRRLAMPYGQAMAWLEGRAAPPEGQIAEEIAYLLQFYGSLKPRVFLSYDREAYACRAGGDLRITFDNHILCRRTALDLSLEPDGVALLPSDQVLMEVKSCGGMPLWLTELLSREQIFKDSFSKYGTAYETMIYQGGSIHA